MDIDVNEPDIATRYSQGISDGIAHAYGMPRTYGSGSTAPPGAYVRGYLAGYRSVWKARYQRKHDFSGVDKDKIQELVDVWVRERNVTLTGRLRQPMRYGDHN